jgi:hypothetical protein
MPMLAPLRRFLHRASVASTISGKSLSPPASVVYVFVNPNSDYINVAPASNASDSVHNFAAGGLNVPSVIHVRLNDGDQAQVDNEPANIANPEANGSGRTGEDEAGEPKNAETGREKRGGPEAAANRGVRNEAQQGGIQEAWATERRHLAAIGSLLVGVLVVSSVGYPTWTNRIPEAFRMSYSDIEQAVLFAVTWSTVAAILLHSLPVSSRLLVRAVVAVGGAVFTGVRIIVGWILHQFDKVLRLSMDRVRRSMRFILVGMALLCGAVVVAYAAVAMIISLWLFKA